MLKFNIFKRAANKTIIGVLITGSLFALFGSSKAIASDNSNSKKDVFGLELSYRDSALQCGKNGPKITVEVDVYDKRNNLITTMSKGDKYMSNAVDSVSDLRFKYNLKNTDCAGLYLAKDSKILGSGDSLPDIAGFSGQSSVKQILAGLNAYEELFLVELGTKDKKSSAYDLQDVIFVVNNNPVLPD